MHNYCKAIGAVAAVSALVAGNAMANVEYELSAGYRSEYIFRGINKGQDLVEAAASARGEWNDFSVAGGVWYGTFDNGTGNEAFNEIDLWADVGYDLAGYANLNVGYIYRYTTEGGDWDSTGNQEIYAGLSKEFYGWQTSLTYYWAVENDNDGYTELAVSKEWAIPGYDCLSIGYNTRLGYLAEEGDFTHWSNRLSFNWGFAENARISPFVQYDVSLSEGGSFYDGNLANYRGAKNQITGGCLLSVKF